ncbi:hypothetical protein PG985_005059 [Apiospora marii]|uniref:Uncharacterized protein n=1 Tax=Apiospora marii TaxID=335849 RepID=A0ABR1SC98_9PEZI
MQLRRSVSQTFGSAHPALHAAVPTATREDDEKRREIWRGLGLGVNGRRTSSRSNNNNAGETAPLSLLTPSTSTPTAEIQLRLQEQLQRLKQHTAAHNNQSSARNWGEQQQQQHLVGIATQTSSETI